MKNAENIRGKRYAARRKIFAGQGVKNKVWSELIETIINERPEEVLSLLDAGFMTWIGAGDYPIWVEEELEELTIGELQKLCGWLKK